MVSKAWRLGALGAIVAGGVLSGSGAEAFTVHTSESGVPARWLAEDIEFVVDSSYLDLGPEALEAFQAAVDAWADIPDAYAPKITVRVGEVDAIGFHSGKPNMNTLRFLPDGYPPAGEGLMITVVSYDAGGAIVDADLVVNGGPKRPFGFVTGPDTSADKDEKPKFFDVQNVLTHELGHVFGLDEEPEVDDATMFPTSKKGETKKRDLHADDVAGIQTLYADPPPSDTASSACSVAGAGRASSMPLGLGSFTAAIGACAVLRYGRRRSGSTARS